MKDVDRIVLEHGDILAFDDEFNRQYQHAVSSENDPCANEAGPSEHFDSRVSLVVWGLPGAHIVPAVMRSNPREPVTCVTLWHTTTTLDLSSVTLAFTVQGPQIARAMLLGKKAFENRSWIIPPGWYALHIGAAEGITEEQELRLEKTFPECPPAEKLTRSCLVGFVLLGPAAAKDMTNDDVWAVGPFCHPILNSCILPRPVKMTGHQKLWNFDKMNGYLPCMK